MTKKADTVIEINVNAISMIHNACLPLVSRIESTIEDHYRGDFEVSTTELTSLLEVKLSADILLGYLEELILQAEEHSVDKLTIPPEEVTLITTLAKSINAAEITKFTNFSLREH